MTKIVSIMAFLLLLLWLIDFKETNIHFKNNTFQTTSISYPQNFWMIKNKQHLCVSEHVCYQHHESLRVTSTHLSSSPQSFGYCDSSAAMGASISAQTLMLVDFTFNHQSLIRSATRKPRSDQLTASRVSADLGEWE